MILYLEVQSDDAEGSEGDALLRRRLFDLATHLMDQELITVAEVGRGVAPPLPLAENYFALTEGELRKRLAEAIRFAAQQAARAGSTSVVNPDGVERISLPQSSLDMRTSIVDVLHVLARSVESGSVKVP